MHLAATFKTCARNTIGYPHSRAAISPPREERLTGPPPPLLTAPPAELHPSCRAAYHYHANTLGVRQSPCKIAQPLFLALRFIHPTVRPRSSFLVRRHPLPHPRPSSHTVSTPVPTSHQLPSHICKTCHYYNNITPMNLPLNMRSTIVDCIANYLPGGVIRTGLDRSRFCHAPFLPSSFFLRVTGDHR